MSIVIANDGTTVEAGQAAPLPAGTKVLANILPTTKEGTTIHKVQFAKQGPNSTITALFVRFRVADGQKGAGRNVFARVPLARKFNTPSAKFPNGAPCYDFFGFFRALGYDVDAPEGFAVPEDHELLGRELELVLTVEDDGEGGQRNGVRFFNEPKDITFYANQAPIASAPAQPAQQWSPGTTPQVQQQAPQQGAPWNPQQAAAPNAQQGAPVWNPNGPSV